MICNDTHLACWRPGYTECRKLSLQSRCDPAESHILSMPFTPLLGFLTPLWLMALSGRLGQEMLFLAISSTRLQVVKL